jgi:hypothetical protein
MLPAHTCKTRIYPAFRSADKNAIVEAIETLSNYFKVLPTGIAQTKE